MTFELIKKDYKGDMARIKPHQIAVGKTTINFGYDAKILFEGFCAAEIYVDKDNKLLGFKPTNDENIGYMFPKNNAKAFQITIKKLKDFNIPKGKYEFTLEDEMLVIKWGI